MTMNEKRTLLKVSPLMPKNPRPPVPPLSASAATGCRFGIVRRKALVIIDVGVRCLRGVILEPIVLTLRILQFNLTLRFSRRHLCPVLVIRLAFFLPFTHYCIPGVHEIDTTTRTLRS